MQMYPRSFPRHRLNDPFRQAEKRIYEALETCGARGFAYYEWQRNKQSLHLDFALWIPDVGRFGLQVKGGHYSFSEGEWYRRRGRRGSYGMVNTCPLAVTSDSTMSLLNEVSETLQQPSYFVPVLLFPDMEPNAAISARARRSNVHLVWQADRLLPRLLEIAREAHVLHPPVSSDIRSEIAVITDGQVRYSEHIASGNPSGSGPVPAASISAPGLLISSAGKVRFHGRAPDRRATPDREDPDM